ncbi:MULTISPECIES: response regulator [Nitrosomonas]|uniref:response regulator n=1 Tax=Nitrosomonas TaxID=914 RepID=UPI0023F37750|nr:MULTISPECIES: response regulator [Nitrosomonas]
MTVRTILVVDDSPTDRHIISDILIRNGYQVGVAESGEEGVIKAREIWPDLVLMDVVMPGINGYQATRILARDCATRHIPVILCTTKDQQTDKIWGLRQGARDYITKPVVAAELLQKIAGLN